MRHSIAVTLCLLAFCLSTSLAAEDPWRTGFTTPPESAKPQTWWHWMNGNITKEGITADLEAMHRVGIAEANIITVASDIPPGPVPVMSPQFFDMVEFAAKEADRLGMTLCLDNCPGWSSSGGPWVTPEHAMQFVVSSEKQVKGPARFAEVLPQPPTKLGFYRDISVLAFKTPQGEDAPPLSRYSPKITSSVPGMDVSRVLDASASGSISLGVPEAGSPQFVQIEFPAEPFSARTLVLTPAAKNLACSGTVQVWDDGKTFRNIAPIDIPRTSTSAIAVSLGQQPVKARFYRIEITKAAANATGINLSKIDLTPRLMIEKLGAKAGFDAREIDPREVALAEAATAPAEMVVKRDEIVDLTSSTHPDGTLEWQVPPGNWTILRFGYTPTGVTNHPAPKEATGLECDKLSKAGLDASWRGMMQPIIDRLGPLSGKVIVDCLIDSYETGGQNWTPRMVEEFKKRRGYDPTRYLPVTTGRIVESPGISERFLWDLRRTIADLFADNYFAYFTELCHQHGMQSLIEPYTGPFESLQSGAMNDVPMGEFWAGSNSHPSVKLASSIGHIYGHRIIGAESFTGRPDHGRWTDDPYSLKALGDLAFCQGINRYIFHRFAHQPWMDKFPGMTMGQWGINLDRTNTWFEKSGPWMAYIARSQFLLQQGRFVADVAYFCGESAPALTRAGTPPLPGGFDYDSINADVLLNKASVKDGRLVLEDGMSYAVLVLPEADRDMTPTLLRRLQALVNDGLTVVGAKPLHSPSLAQYPACDEEVKNMATALWGDCDGKTVTEHATGKGKVVWGESLERVLAGLNLAPDFDGGNSSAPMIYIHRTSGEGEIYFVANRGNAFVNVDCTFRVAGKMPELWHPDSGTIEDAPLYTESNGRTMIPLRLDPSGSVFVLFRKPDPAKDHLVSVSEVLAPENVHLSLPVGGVPHDPAAFEVRRAEDGGSEMLALRGGSFEFKTALGKNVKVDATGTKPRSNVDGPWELHFPPHWGAPEKYNMPELASWSDAAESGVKYFSGTATYVKELEVPAELLGEGRALYLDLGTVKNIAEVNLNGQSLGILWKPPFRVDVSGVAKSGKNALEISVTNLWPNRLIGDAQLPEDVEWSGMKPASWPQWLLDGKPSPTGRLTFTTWRHWTRDGTLLPSGMLGPVELQPGRWVKVQ